MLQQMTGKRETDTKRSKDSQEEVKYLKEQITQLTSTLQNTQSTVNRMKAELLDIRQKQNRRFYITVSIRIYNSLKGTDQMMFGGGGRRKGLLKKTTCS